MGNKMEAKCRLLAAFMEIRHVSARCKQAGGSLRSKL